MRRLLSALALACVACAPPADRPLDGALGESLARGEVAYRAGRVGDAQLAFEEALDSPDAPLGAVQHALGACAFRAGDYPRAVLWYRRAERALDRPATARADRRLAEHRLGLARTGASADGTLDALAHAVDDLGAANGVAACVALEVLGLAGLVLVRRRRAVRWLSAACVLLALVAAGRVAWRTWAPPPREAVALEPALLRDAPHPTRAVLADVLAGETVRVLEASARWARVERGTVRGWVPAEAVEEVGARRAERP